MGARFSSDYLAPFLKAMTHLFAFIFGFALCATLCWKRLRESRRAFVAASEQNAALRERERRRRESLSKVFARASEIRNILGGTVTLPAAARTRAGQRVPLRITTKLKGPSVNGGPDFSGRGACESKN